MLVSEILLKKLYVEDKCRELKDYLSSKIPTVDSNHKSKLYNDYLSLYFDALDELRTYKIYLHEANKDREIIIGNSSVSVFYALKLIENLESKINILTDIIQSEELLGISNFITERDKLINEYLAVISAIKKDDWNVEVD